MRLLEIDHMGGIGFTPDMPDTALPPYAILSHTWDHGHEVTYDDMLEGTAHTKRGWRKIQFCERQAPRDSLSHFWVDSCCIDKANHGEIHGALGSMFAWYRDAHVCYVYLTDVKTTAESDLLRSRWWTRGWTLQELLAPRDVRFFARSGQYLCDKATLEGLISRRTGIPAAALQGAPFDSFTAEEQLSWIGNRQTTYPEDMYNCLMGIFGESLARRYEGARRRTARKRERDTRAKAKVIIKTKTKSKGKGKGRICEPRATSDFVLLAGDLLCERLSDDGVPAAAVIVEDLVHCDEPLYSTMNWCHEGQEMDVSTIFPAPDNDQDGDVEDEEDDAEWWRQTTAGPATAVLDAYEATPGGIPEWEHYLPYPCPGKNSPDPVQAFALMEPMRNTDRLQVGGLDGSMEGAHTYTPQLDPTDYQSHRDDRGYIGHV